MADFAFNLRTHSPDVLDTVSSALGSDGENKFRHDADRGKAVVLAGEGTHELCANGDEITGFIDSIKGITVNDGNSFGGVRRGGTAEAVIGANQDSTAPAKVGDLVVADDQAAAGVKGTAQVRTGSPTKYKWEITSVKGDGTTGTRVVLERL